MKKHPVHAFLFMFVYLFSPFAVNAENKKMNSDTVIMAFQKTVSSASKQVQVAIKSPIRIALIYPSSDISDFWVRNYTALIKRLDELNIPHVTKEFSSRQVEHALQGKYTDEVIKNSNSFDFVIFGPSELDAQAKNIQKLSKNEQF